MDVLQDARGIAMMRRFIAEHPDFPGGPVAPYLGWPDVPTRRVWPSRLAVLGLVLVGLSQVAGHVVHAPGLELLGKMTGAAPLPLVFDLVDGLEYWALQHEVQIVTADGTIDLRSTPALFSRIRGPHVVKIAYIFPFSLAPILPDDVRESLLRQALCDGGKLAQDFALPDGIAEIRLGVWHPRGRGAWHFSVTCPP